METNWYDEQLHFAINLNTYKSIWDSLKNTRSKLIIVYYDKYNMPIIMLNPDTLSGFDDFNRSNIKEFENLVGNSINNDKFDINLYGIIPCSKQRYLNIKNWDLKIN
jgi:hypothetical protein